MIRFSISFRIDDSRDRSKKFQMRFAILLNAVPLIFAAKHHGEEPVVNTAETTSTSGDLKTLSKGDKREIESPDHMPRKKETEPQKDHKEPQDVEKSTSVDGSSSPWKQYTEGSRDDWMKYLSKPGSNGTDDGTQFDWMKYAAPYMNTNGSNSNDSSDSGSSFNWQQFSGQYMGGNSGDNTTSTQWNNGQGDGFGEPFRSQTGGDFRYKAGRDWGNSTTGGGDQGGFDWHQFAAPYSNVNPSQPGTQNQSSGGDFDWHQYAGQYMSGGGQGGQSSGDWQKYAAPYMGGQTVGGTDKNPAAQVPAGPASGGYFEVEVSGTNLNVTTTFGLGQGRAANGTSDSSTTGEAGGGGGQQTFMTADEGRIFLRGNFLNKLDPNVVPA